MLECRQLSCGYGKLKVITEVSLKLAPQELLAIIGPNGSGKTTLLRAISRLIKPMTGGIYLEDQNVWEIEALDFAKTVAVVSQYLPSVEMTVEDYVLLGRMPHFQKMQFIETPKDLQVVNECMQMTDILHLKDKIINRLSSGERQLAQIARALAQSPTLLLLDEPTAHLDITHQVVILDLLKKLISQIKLTVVMVLHDLNLASEYASCLGLMSAGRLIKLGAPHEVIDYKIIEEVYKTKVVVDRNPVSSKPCVFIVPKEELLKHRNL